MVTITPGRSRRRPGGFTLPELMMGVAIIGVLGVVAVPNFSTLVDKQRVSGASTDLFSALMRTRSEAIRRNTEVTLTPTSPGQWHTGWTIPDPADSALIFDAHGAIPHATISGPSRVVYLANGRIKGASAPVFNLVAPDGSGRCIRVDLSGRPNQKNTVCAS